MQVCIHLNLFHGSLTVKENIVFLVVIFSLISICTFCSLWQKRLKFRERIHAVFYGTLTSFVIFLVFLFIVVMLFKQIQTDSITSIPNDWWAASGVIIAMIIGLSAFSFYRLNDFNEQKKDRKKLMDLKKLQNLHFITYDIIELNSRNDFKKRINELEILLNEGIVTIDTVFKLSIIAWKKGDLEKCYELRELSFEYGNYYHKIFYYNFISYEYYMLRMSNPSCLIDLPMDNPEKIFKDFKIDCDRSLKQRSVFYRNLICLRLLYYYRSNRESQNDKSIEHTLKIIPYIEEIFRDRDRCLEASVLLALNLIFMQYLQDDFIRDFREKYIDFLSDLITKHLENNRDETSYSNLNIAYFLINIFQDFSNSINFLRNNISSEFAFNNMKSSYYDKFNFYNFGDLLNKRHPIPKDLNNPLWRSYLFLYKICGYSDSFADDIFRTNNTLFYQLEKEILYFKV